MPTIRRLEDQVLSKLNKYYLKKTDTEIYCVTRFPDNHVEALVASCDAVLILNALGKLPTNKHERNNWVNYINSFQDEETGFYLDNISNWSQGNCWTFGMVLRALNALGGHPKYKLNFLCEWIYCDKLNEWLYSGKNVMHMGIVWLRSIKKYRTSNFYIWENMFFETLEGAPSRLGGPDRDAWRKVITEIDESSKVVDYWDPFHTLFLYYASKRDIPNIELWINWLIEDQDENDLFYGGTPYRHMDGLQMLTEFSLRCSYRRQEVLNAIKKGTYAVINNCISDLEQDNDIHNILARVETISQAMRILDLPEFCGHKWKSAWDLNLWRVQQQIIPEKLLVS